MNLTNDYNELIALINSFRSISAPDAISPEDVGALMHRITTFANNLAALNTKPDEDAGVVAFNDVVSNVTLNTSSPTIPAADSIDDRQATAPDGCELVYSSLDGRFYARKAKSGGAGYTWFYYPHERDIWGEPNPEVSGKGILGRAGYLFVCRNTASGHNGEVYVCRYVLRSDGRKGTQLVRLASASDLAALNTAKADKTAIPTPQSMRSATAADKMYVYSVEDPQAKNSVLNAPDTKLRQVNGKLKLQKGLWNPNGEARYWTLETIDAASTIADGVLTKEIFSRLGGAGNDAPRIYVSSTTTTGVTITYPNWASGGTRTFTIGQATSARAGVMTSAQYNKLTALPMAEQLQPAIQTVGAFDFVALPGSTLPVPQDNLKLGCEFLAGELTNITEYIVRPFISYNGAWHALPASVEDLGYIDTINDSRLCFDADNSFVHLNPVMLFRIDDDYMIPSEHNGIYAVSEDNYPSTSLTRIITIQNLDRYLPNTAAMQASINALQTQLQEALARIAALESTINTQE